MKKHQDAPKIVNIGVWGSAILSSLVLAISLGIYFTGLLNNPISANETTTTETEAEYETVAINNYPTRLNDGTHAGYYVDGDMNWRCSHLKVKKGTTYEQVAEMLEGSLVDGEKAKVYRSVDEFNKDVKDGGESKKQAMLRGFLVPSFKKSCEGLNSVDYGKITTKEGDGEEEIEKETRADTSYIPPAEPAQTESDITGVGAVAGPGAGGAGSSDGESSSELELPVTTENLKSCMNKVNDFLVNYKNNTTFDKQIYSGIENLYRQLKKNVENNNVSLDRAYTACKEYEKVINNNIPNNTRNEGVSISSNPDEICKNENNLKQYINNNVKLRNIRNWALDAAKNLNYIRHGSTTEYQIDCKKVLETLKDFDIEIKNEANKMNKIEKIWTSSLLIKGETNNKKNVSLIKAGNDYYWSTRVKISVKYRGAIISKYVYFRAKAITNTETKTVKINIFRSEEKNVRRVITGSSNFSQYDQSTNFIGEPKVNYVRSISPTEYLFY